MTPSKKIIGSIAIIGVLYSVIRLFESGNGGASLENAFAGIMYTVLAVFIASTVVIVANRKNLSDRREEVYLFSFTGIVLLLVLIDKLIH
jgi:hypothetical protein